MAMALDEPRDSDKVFEDNGFKFCVDSNLYEQVGGIKVDAGYMGFIVESERPLSSGGNCGSCGSGCGGN